MSAAWVALLKRYAAVWRGAWAERASMEPVKRSPDELAFLPAHLELIEQPTSPTARWTMRCLIALFSVALIWACVGQVDIVAVAQGRTVVGSRSKLVQPVETAVVKRILVRDGQSVQAGDLLIELDATLAQADLQQARTGLLDARLAELRFSALALGLQTGSAPLLAAADDLPADLPESRLSAEQQLASSQFEAYRARHQALEASIAQRQAELDTLSASVEPLNASARIAAERALDYGRLVEKGHVGRHDYLLVEQQRIDAERDLAAQRNRLHEVRSALAAAKDELDVLRNDTRRQVLDGQREAAEQARQLQAELAKADQRDRLMALRAPVSGTVQQLAVHSVGGVVTPAQPLMVVVPDDESLEIEAQVLNKDIGFVRSGQIVTVKVESFPYTRYGHLEGEVESVSLDAAQDEQLGLVFPARVRLERSALTIDGVDVRLSAGMNVSVEVKTGQRRIIDFLLSPLRSHSSEALRER
ncbi:HlyD family type I secretion periplasmic adaptor subunit [Pseudomarimonas arenosa]|uniref:Membrane fusion protein (MFP) family protein n=1 Tax=Pseudomarimonas arenosa TaxID=2774145 RepID=A0AAW3ZN74_9GAMM|nr:HlyD family type I secretion periplasmic adaptor subunit [Pseudomarimonas arenosa]MBD8525821.1 HlyD family type I secretion periplasmic adaptor subunit [Pseudomarimonas arenosa]